MGENAIKIENLKKQYKLGTIGGQTLNAELQSWWARKRGKEDPNLKIGQSYSQANEKFWALNGINLEVKKGEALGIIGGNGAGKSTLLKILSRVTAPTEGDIWIDGRVSSMLEVGTGFHPELTGRENIYMNGAILGMTKKEVDAKIESIIDFSECRQFIDTPVKRYSSGMYVKLAFAVASHLDAEIMIMDEVLAVGDMKFQKKCLGKMGDEAKSGKTVLYVSHNMTTIRNLCTRCIVLDKGQIIFDGDVEKAINLYLDVSKGTLASYYDFHNVKRVQLNFGTKVKIFSWNFVDKESAKYGTREKMRVIIKWNAYVDNINVRFRASIARVDGTIVGTVFSKEAVLGKKGYSYESLIEFDSTNLAEGAYVFYLLAFERNEYGAIENLDKPEQPIYFEIYVDDNNENWNALLWGPIRLNPFEIIHNEEGLIKNENINIYEM